MVVCFPQVKKIFESERRLHAGDHSVELLAQDFEKNYNMYIYPVHWQFAQLDQHPSDRYILHIRAFSKLEFAQPLDYIINAHKLLPTSYRCLPVCVWKPILPYTH